MQNHGTRIGLVMAMAVAASVAQAATVYKCTDERGRTVYSQQRCAEDAAALEVKPIPGVAPGEATWAGPSEEYQAGTERHEDRMNQVRIRNAENHIKVLIKERDDKVAEYRREMMRSAYNSAGVARNQKYQALIDATQESYGARIAAKRAEIADLRSKLHH